MDKSPLIEYIKRETKSPIEWEQKEAYEKLYSDLNNIFNQLFSEIEKHAMYKNKVIGHVSLNAFGKLVDINKVESIFREFGIDVKRNNNNDDIERERKAEIRNKTVQKPQRGKRKPSLDALDTMQ